MRAVLLSLLILAPAHARAQAEDGVVRVVAFDCSAVVERALFTRLLATELRGDGVSSVEGDEREALAVIEVGFEQCEPGATSVRVQIDDRVTQKRVTRAIDLEGVPASLRERTLAIATAELLRASWLELIQPDPPEPEVAPPPVVRERVVARVARALGAPERSEGDEPAQPSATRWGRFALGAAAVARFFPSTGLAVFGGRVSFNTGLFEHTGFLRADLGLQGGSASDVLGAIDVVAVPVGVTFGARVLAGDLMIELGARLEGGPVWVGGRPAGPDIESASSVEAMMVIGVAGSLTWRVARSIWLGVGVDAGWTAVGFDALADTRAATGMSGPTGSLELVLHFAD